MANASSKKFGPGQQDQGKGDGSGGMAPADIDALPPGEVLSNRDTSRHSEQRGLDSRHVQTEQYHESIDNHDPGDGAPDPVAHEKLADERPGPGEDLPSGIDRVEAGPQEEESDEK